MKYYKITSLLEATAKKPLDVDTVTLPLDLKIIRFVDYVTIGIDENFMHRGSNAGGSIRAKSRANGKGNQSTHVDTCNSCVNMIVTKKHGYDSFSNLTYEDVLVPRIPAEYTGTEDDVDSEWTFIEKCQSYMDRLKGSNTVIGLSGNKDSTMFLKKDRSKIGPNTLFYKSSLLYGYMLDEDAIAVVHEGDSVVIELKPGFINTDADMKYIDAELEVMRPKALELLAKIYDANPDDLSEGVENSGNVSQDIKRELLEYKKIVPRDGDVFLSANEISKYLNLLEYFKRDPEDNVKTDSLLQKLNKGMNDLQKQGITFGEYTGMTKKVQEIITNGNYDVTFGYSQAGDDTHSETFGNKGEQVFFGYIDNVPGQSNDMVIPIYITTFNKSAIDTFNSNLGKPYKMPSKDTLNAYLKLNTDLTTKIIGDNSTVFQLPAEAYMTLLKNEKSPESTESKVEPTVDIKEPEGAIKPDENTKTNKKGGKGKKPKKSEESTATPKNEPVTEPIVDPTPAPATTQVPAAKRPKVGKKGDKVAGETNSGATALAKPVNKSIIRDKIHSELFSDDVKDAPLAKSGLYSVVELVKSGHEITDNERNILLKRGSKLRGPQAFTPKDLDNAIASASKSKPLQEARVSRSSFSIKTLMENISANRLK